MPRLDQIVEPLFSQPGADLLLESNSTGTYRKQGTPDVAVFRQTLRTGQILLLFADVVPKEQSQSLLTGQPIDFQYTSPHGPLAVHMEMRGSDIRVEVKTVEVRPLGFKSTETPLPTPVSETPGLSLVQLIAELPDRRASHLHLTAGAVAFLRVEGSLVPLADAGPFTHAQIREALAAIAPSRLREVVSKHARFDFTSVSKTSVFHVRAQEGRAGLSVVIRSLPRDVPTPESLGVPPAMVTGVDGAGLWVIAGPAGHGASTTLSALAQAVLNSRPSVVYAVESPIEYVLSPSCGVAQQLEVGTHVNSYAEALVQARALDTDLVVVGEFEEGDTLTEAIALADRGRLVIGSLHAAHSVDAIEKLFSSLEGQRATQLRLSNVLRGVFAQQLLPNAAGGRSLAWEMLENSNGVRALLRAPQLVPAQLAACRTFTMEQRLADLVTAGEVDAELALNLAPERARLERLLGNRSSASAASRAA